MTTPRSFLLALLALIACGGGSTSTSNSTPAEKPAALDESRSTLVVKGSSDLVADGHETAEIDLSLIDVNGAALKGVKVDVVVSGEGNTVHSAGVTDAKGALTATLSTTSAGTKTVSAVAHLASGLTPLYDQATVSFSAGTADHLGFVALPSTASAGSHLGVKVAFEDAHDNVVDTAVGPVTVTVAGITDVQTGVGGDLVEPAVNGVATFDTLSIAPVGQYALTASAVGMADVQSAPFTIVAAQPSAQQSGLQLYWYTTVSDTVPPQNNVTGVARDGYGNPCGGCRFEIEMDGSGNQIQPASGLTDANGNFGAAVASTQAGRKNVTATVNGTVIGRSDMQFQPGPVSVDTSSFSTDTDQVLADGTARAVLSLALRDRFGNPYSGYSVVTVDGPVSSDNAPGYNNQLQPYLNSQGLASIHVTSTKAQTVTFQIDGLSTQVTFFAGPASQLLVTAPTLLYAGEPFAAQIQVADAHGNPLTSSGDVTVSLSDPGGASVSGTLTQPLAAGAVTFSGLSVSQSATGAKLHAVSGPLMGDSAAIAVKAFRVVGPWGGDVTAITGRSDGTLFAGTAGGGLYVSNDGAQSWAYAGNSGLDPNIQALDSLSSWSQHALAAGTPSGVYRSGDDGATWQQELDTAGDDVRWLSFNYPVILAGTTTGTKFETIYTAGWTASLNTPSSLTTVSSHDGYFAGTPDGRLFTSGDSGHSWYDLSFDFGAPVTGAAYGAYGNGYVAATDGNGLFHSTDSHLWSAVTGLSSQNFSGVRYAYPNFFAFVTGQGLLRSGNGTNWSAVTGLPNVTARGLATGQNASHNGVVAIATDQGVFASTDSGATWTAQSTGLANLAIARLVAIPGKTGSWLAATLNRGVFESDDGGLSWTPRSTGLATQSVSALAFSPTVSGTVIAATDQGIFVSTDGALHWSAAASGPTSSDLTDVVFDASGTAYAASATGGVFSSTDGATWTGANNGLGSLVVRALLLDGTTLYAATDGGVFSTDVGLIGWFPCNTGLGSLDVRSLAVDANHQIYAGTEGSIFASTDQGANWTSFASLGVAVQSIAIDPQTPGRVYAGTPSGLEEFESGNTTQLSSGLRTEDVLSLALDPTDGTLLVGTRGSSVARSRSHGH